MGVDDQIIEFIKERGQANPTDLAKASKFSDSAINKSLAKLVAKGMLTRTTQGRNSFYKISAKANSSSIPQTPQPITTQTPIEPQPIESD